MNKEKCAKAEANGEDVANVRVHIGLGAGFIAEKIAERYSYRSLKSGPTASGKNSKKSIHEDEPPKLTIHAVTPGGYYLEEQLLDPTAYARKFVEGGVDVKFEGFFVSPLVSVESFDDLRNNPSLRACFDKRDEIDVVITSLARANDEDGLIRKYFDALKKQNYFEIPADKGTFRRIDPKKDLEEQGWIGDVLFQPYSKTKPIVPKSYRTIALFDIEALRKFAERPGKRVVLIAAPCGKCHQSKAEALLPLLLVKDLRICTDLVLDVGTANDILEMTEGKETTDNE
ncbi:MAG: hypothetical protein HUK22_07340 [Thermoguttaceae bacterium]|nr:hypothetical protein [Thermoguttaceae bacterium]